MQSEPSSGNLVEPSNLQTPSILTPSVMDGRHVDVAGTLNSLPELARLLANADYGAVTVYEDGRVIRMIYAGLTEDEATQIGEPPVGSGLLGRLGVNDAPLRVGDIASHPKSVGFPPGHPAMESLIGVRVTTHFGRIANLYVARKPGREDFTAADEVKIAALASYAEIALDNARLYEQEQRLRAMAQAAEQRMAAVIKGSAAGVVVKDAATNRYVQISGEARRISGVDFDDVSAADEHHFESLYHWPDGKPMAAEDIPMNQAIASGESVGPREVLFIRADGGRIPVLVSSAPVFKTGGEIDSAVCVFVDITRIKELDQAKDDFLSMITHDLRTPLTTIKGLAAAALDSVADSRPDAAIGFLEPIDEEVDYLAELVANLLDMTRIEAGGDMFDFEVCHLADIATDSVARMNRSRDGHGRRIHVNVPPDLPAVYADPGQIGRVMDNLLSNALKYSEDDIGVVARFEPANGTIRVEVSDRGPGIPEGQEKAIFDRFARLKGAGRRGRQGSGLGLAICRSIVTAHSGDIGVVSSERGSNFWFSLPIDRDYMHAQQRHIDKQA